MSSGQPGPSTAADDADGDDGDHQSRESTFSAPEVLLALAASNRYLAASPLLPSPVRLPLGAVVGGSLLVLWLRRRRRNTRNH